MYQKISSDLHKTYNSTFNHEQVKSRYEYLKQKYKKDVANNNSSGREAKEIDYKSEFDRIAGIDDSISPTLIRNSRGILTEKDVNMLPEDDLNVRKRKKQKNKVI